MKPLMKINDVCEYLGISRATVYRLVNDRQLKAYRVGERMRFKQEEVDALVKVIERVPRYRGKTLGDVRPKVCPHCGRERCRIDHGPNVPLDAEDEWPLEGI